MLLERRHMPDSQSHYLFLENMISKQQEKIKSSIIDANSCLNRIFPSFNSLSNEFHPGSRLIDIFSNHFSFYKADYCYDRCLLETAWTWVKGMTIWLAVPHVVSVSASCRRCCYLALSLWSLHVLILVYVSLLDYGLV